MGRSILNKEEGGEDKKNERDAGDEKTEEVMKIREEERKEKKERMRKKKERRWREKKYRTAIQERHSVP